MWLKKAEEDDDVPGMNIDQGIGEEEFPQDDQPQDDDIVIENGTRAYQNGREIARAKDWNILEMMLHRHMESQGFYPNVWRDGNLSQLDSVEELRKTFVQYDVPKIEDEIIAGIEYYGPEPVHYSDLYDNAIKHSDFRSIEDEFGPLFDLALMNLQGKGRIQGRESPSSEGEDMFILVPEPSTSSYFDPQSLPDLDDPRQKQQILDRLLDQYNSTSDPGQRQQLEQRMKSLGWLKLS